MQLFRTNQSKTASIAFAMRGPCPARKPSMRSNRRSGDFVAAISYPAFIAAILLNGSGAHAQAVAANAAPSAETAGAPDIVVTAERRQSTVQSSPLSITALTGEDLARRGVANIADLARAVPGIAIRSAGPGQTEVAIRGLASTGGASPTVGFYLDDTPLTAPASSTNGKVVIDPALYDLARVEVLRGPQGTLYGSGSEGGTIRLITTEPKLNAFSGTVNLDGSGTVGGGANVALNGAVNIPLVSDIAALRVVATYKHNSGWIDRIVEDPFPLGTNNGCAATFFYACARGDVANGNIVKNYKDVNDERLRGGRIELLLYPTPDLKILTTILYQKVNQGGANTFDFPPGGNPVQAHYQPADVKEPFEDRFALISNTLSYNLGFADVSVSTSYWNRRERQTQDAGELYQNLFSLPNFLTATSQSLTETDPSQQFSEEIRLASRNNGRFKWIVGAFYSKFSSAIAVYGATPELSFASVGGSAANPDGVIYTANVPYHIRQLAAFGELSYEITPSIAATVGLRYFDFANSIDYTQAGILGPTGNTVPDAGRVVSRDSGMTPKFNLSYKPNRKLTLYATAAEGFRSGGVNLPAPVTGPGSCLPYLASIGLSQSPRTFDPDTVWNYEVGGKARLFNGRLTVNADVYYIKWHDVQQTINIPVCGYPYTANAGDATSYGPELEVSYRVTDRLTISANATYTHATLTSVKPGAQFNVGERLLNIPRYTENTSITYDWPISDKADASLTISNSLVGPSRDIVTDFVNLPTYNIVNFRAELAINKVRYGLYVNNLTDTHAKITANTTRVTIPQPSLIRFATNQPLTIGLDLKYAF